MTVLPTFHKEGSHPPTFILLIGILVFSDWLDPITFFLRWTKAYQIGIVRFELTTSALSAQHSTTELYSFKIGVDINIPSVSVFGLKNLSLTNRSFMTEEVNLRDHKGQVGTPGIEPRPHVLQTYVPTNLHHVPKVWKFKNRTWSIKVGDQLYFKL